jgi:hypothetical protein
VRSLVNPPPPELFIRWTNFYGTSYVCRGIRANLSVVLHKSRPAVCIYVYPPLIARQRLGKNVSAATNTPSNRRIVGCAVFYAVLGLSNEVDVSPAENFLCLYGNFSWRLRNSRVACSRTRQCLYGKALLALYWKCWRILQVIFRRNITWHLAGRV